MYIFERDEYREKHNTGPSWGFWHLWVWVISLAFAIAKIVQASLELFVGQEGPLRLGVVAAEGALTGMVVGIAQALLLARYLNKSAAFRWVKVTTIAWAARLPVVFLVTTPLLQFYGELWFSNFAWIATAITMGAIGGDIIGLAQAPVLRPYVEHAGRWRWSNLVGGAASGFFTIGASYYNYPDYPSYNLAQDQSLLPMSALEGIVFAAITGITLLDMLRHLRGSQTITP